MEKEKIIEILQEIQRDIYESNQVRMGGPNYPFSTRKLTKDLVRINNELNKE